MNKQAIISFYRNGAKTYQALYRELKRAGVKKLAAIFRNKAIQARQEASRLNKDKS